MIDWDWELGRVDRPGIFNCTHISTDAWGELRSDLVNFAMVCQPFDNPTTGDILRLVWIRISYPMRCHIWVKFMTQIPGTERTSYWMPSVNWTTIVDPEEITSVITNLGIWNLVVTDAWYQAYLRPDTRLEDNMEQSDYEDDSDIDVWERPQPEIESEPLFGNRIADELDNEPECEPVDDPETEPEIDDEGEPDEESEEYVI